MEFSFKLINLQVEWGCNYCEQTYKAHPTRQREHLKVCRKYLKSISKDSNEANTTFNDQSDVKSAQSEINFPRLTSMQKHDLDLQAAMWCYMANQPFNMYENPFSRTFLRNLNPAYKPPSRNTISGPLLEEVHSNIKTRTDILLSSLDCIDVSTDESSNITSARICNISVHSKYGALYYVSEDIGAKRMTSLAATQWLRNHLLVLSNHRLDRVNSITNDTCQTMRGMWKEIQKFEDLKHCLFVLCDSHGIQLLVGDLLKLPDFNDTIQKAQCIVKSFRHAPLQYARLREFQIEYYGKQQSLILSVITRWGTQYRLVQSLLKSKDAIKRYALEYRSLPAAERLKQPALDAIMDKELWIKLEAMQELLQPSIDERLRMSESGKSHLGHVLHRWKDLFKHLRTKSIEHEGLTAFLSHGGFDHCYNLQVLPVHIVAFYLMPKTTVNDIRNNSTAIPLEFEEKITSFFRQYASSNDNAKLLIREFMTFRAQQPPFEPLRQCWEESDDPWLFWCNAVGLANNLGNLALRIFSAPVNSVASERAFSVQNLIHNKTRNRLQPKRVDKLAFIYTNAPILNQHDVPSTTSAIAADFASKPLQKLMQEEEVRLEDILVELQIEDDDDTMHQDELYEERRKQWLGAG